MKTTGSAILWISAALAPAVIANAATDAAAAQQRELPVTDGQLALTAPANIWPILVQALIVVACATLLIARERRRSYH